MGDESRAAPEYPSRAWMQWQRARIEKETRERTDRYVTKLLGEFAEARMVHEAAISVHQARIRDLDERTRAVIAADAKYGPRPVVTETSTDQ